MARGAGCLLLVVAGVLIRAASTEGQARDAALVLAAARNALGGEQNLTAVRTFVVAGRTRQLRGNNLVPIEFEISCELPDKYVRKDEFPAQDTDVTVSGFRGDQLIVFPEPQRGRGGPPPAQRLMAAKQDFARLMLGAFATSVSSFPLTFRYAAEAEAPEGRGDVLDVSGPAGFTARFVVQQSTHLPVMLMWEAPVGATPPQGATISRGAAAPRGTAPLPGASAPGPLPENRLYFADYRDVKGIKWPFRIRRAIAGNTIEETTFDRVTFNVKIDPKKFEAPK